MRRWVTIQGGVLVFLSEIACTAVEAYRQTIMKWSPAGKPRALLSRYIDRQVKSSLGSEGSQGSQVLNRFEKPSSANEYQRRRCCRFFMHQNLMGEISRCLVNEWQRKSVQALFIPSASGHGVIVAGLYTICQFGKDFQKRYARGGLKSNRSFRVDCRQGRLALLLMLSKSCSVLLGSFVIDSS